MEAILAGMVEGVIVVDAQGRLQLVNDAARRMLQLDDAPEGRHYLEIVRHPAIAAQIGGALARQASDGLELTPPRDPATTLIARARAGRSASPAAARSLVLHDITDLRRADQIRRDFVANVSHELRTPLTAIRGYVEALPTTTPDAEDARRFLEIIARHTLRMERLVKDLLRLARLDAGQEPLEQVPCSIDSLFAAVEADLSHRSSRRRRQTVRRRRRCPTQRSSAAIPRSCRTRCATCSRTPSTTRPRTARS